jgi:L-rhamnose mutarotase
MKRYSFIMTIKPELKTEYIKAHNEIWPDMAKAIRDSGVRNYSIYFRPDGTLFAYLEADDPKKALERLGNSEVNARWQKAMDRFFVKKNPSNIGAEIEEIEEAFHID